jgi:flavin-dependent dehydrogenase
VLATQIREPRKAGLNPPLQNRGKLKVGGASRRPYWLEKIAQAHAGRCWLLRKSSCFLLWMRRWLGATVSRTSDRLGLVRRLPCLSGQSALPEPSQHMPDQTPATFSDVTVIGGGLSGKAASLHLARAGLKVVCIEPAEAFRQPVGESLDWSSPELLSELGLPMDTLISEQMATWKRHVVLKMCDGTPEDYTPLPWLGKEPFHVELRTLHVDRLRLDEELLKKTIDSGVRLVRDKVVRVERNGKQIVSVQTASGERYGSRWFIDASGFATALLAREFELRAVHSGPAKVAVWTYFPVNDSIEGTTLYMQPEPTEYLDWIWEIPINPRQVSVGYVTTGEAMKARREKGLAVGEIFRQQLTKFPRFQSLLTSITPDALNVTSFRSRVHLGVTGPNWLIVGEAASMVDPITANGVTAALRHAAEAAHLILKHGKTGKLPLSARISYNNRVMQLARFFNSGIENVVYRPPIRNRIGLRHSATVYISPAWSMNLLYARMKPRGIFSTFLFAMFLGFFRVTEWIFYRLCKLMSRRAGVQG